MQIGVIIRKYRKEKNMTQEDMANRLGVTAPAVNKWESSVSMPDIMLLGPIARLLGITVDELLSFEAELTDTEINQLVEEAGERLKKEPYDTAFQWTKKQMERYPNCEKLLLFLAAILDANRLFQEVTGSEKYDGFISNTLERLLYSREEEIRNTAAQSLYGFCIRKEEYEKAEKYLAYFSKKDPERKRMQAFLYEHSGRREDAYKAYEELLLEAQMQLSMVFQSMFVMRLKDNDMEKAGVLAEKGKLLSELFEMGDYREYSCALEFAKAQKDVDKTLECASKMLYGVDKINSFKYSPLYEHLTFKKPTEEFYENLKKTLVNLFRDEGEFGYMKGDAGWEELLSFFG